jgi:hypothetical protein
MGGPKTHVGHFLFAKNEPLIGCGVQRLRKVRIGKRSPTKAAGRYSHPRSPNAERSTPGGAYHPPVR